MTSMSNAKSKKEEADLKMAHLDLRLQEFDSIYGKPRAYLDELRRYMGFGEGFKCKTCGCADLENTSSGRAGICRLCKDQTWYTAGTFFHRIRKPRAWLFTIWLMGMGERFNACDLKRLLSIAHSTAQTIIKKVLTVIAEDMQQDSRVIEASSGHFLAAIYKRSRKTPADEHPTAEQDEMEDFTPPTNSTQIQVPPSAPATCLPMLSLGSPTGMTDSAELSEAEKEIVSLLSNTPMHIDELCKRTRKSPQSLSAALMILELNGFIESITSDTFVLASGAKRNISPVLLACGKDLDLLGASVVGFIEYVRSEFRGISRKYLELYLASYWCFLDRKRWSTKSILKACDRFRNVTYEDILAFVSPPMVSLIPV